MTECKNYRGISLLGMAGKIYVRRVTGVMSKGALKWGGGM